MADQKEEIVLQFTIDQKDAFAEMEKMKKVILQTKQEQKELNDAYKKGNITLDEFVNEGVRLEANLKRQQSAYNNVQKSVTGVKTQMDKLIDSNKEISKDLKKTSQSFQDVAGNINVAGVNIGDLTTKFVSFVNPATAAVGVVSALVGAYASSAVGSRDLEKATDQLGAAFKITNDSYGEFVSDLKASRDTGIFEDLAFSFNRLLFGEATANQAKAVANAKQALKVLEIEGKRARGFAKVFEKEAEDARRKRDDDTVQIQERLKAVNAVEENINASGLVRINNLSEQREAVKDISTNYQFDLEAQGKVAELTAEIADIQEEINGKLTENKSAREQIVLLAERLKNAETTGTTALSTGTKTGSDFLKDTGTTDAVALNNEIIIDGARYLNDALNDLDKNRTANEKQQAELRLKINKTVNEAYIDSAIMVFNAASGLARQGSEEQRILALTAIGIDTAEAIAHLTEKSEDNPLNSVTFGAAGVIQFAAGLARILANITAAKNYISGAAAGGGDFMTNGPSLLLVGDNPGGKERVTVEPLSGKGETKIWGPNMMAMAGGGTLTAGGDPGGVITSSLTASANQNLATQNAIKQMAKQQIVVSVKEITKVQNKVQVKERARK